MENPCNTPGRDSDQAFLSHLAVNRNVASSTQNQALAALLFLYREVRGIDLPWLDGIARANKPARLPVVLSVTEVQHLLAHLEGSHHLVASLLYGSGLRLMEALRLRVKDVDTDRLEITVRSGKGGKDRRTVLPRSLTGALARQIERVAFLHEQDLPKGLSPVYLPRAGQQTPRTSAGRSADCVRPLTP